MFTFQLGLKIWTTNIIAQKINNNTLDTYKMVVSNFSISNKDEKERFFEENFLLTDILSDIVLEMLFLAMSNIDVNCKPVCARRRLEQVAGKKLFQAQDI